MTKNGLDDCISIIEIMTQRYMYAHIKKVEYHIIIYCAACYSCKVSYKISYAAKIYFGEKVELLWTTPKRKIMHELCMFMYDIVVISNGQIAFI